jgi:hypothetical protein
VRLRKTTLDKTMRAKSARHARQAAAPV